MTTIQEKLKYSHDVVDRQLARAPRNKVDAAYDRTKYLDERRELPLRLEAWMTTSLHSRVGRISSRSNGVH